MKQKRIQLNKQELVFMKQYLILRKQKMQLDTKPRDFSYINHKENQPLELKGTMKRRQQRPNSYHPLSGQSNTVNLIKEDLANKIVQNYQNLKSIVPVDLNYNKAKKQSVKVYENRIDGQGTGASYLMTKSKTQKPHPQKRHLTQRTPTDGNTQNSIHRQKRHYNEKYSQSTSEFDETPPKKHTETLTKKLTKDLYSQIEMKENNATKCVKMSEKNMFQEGTYLGYEISKQPKISHAKKKEYIGSLFQEQVGNQKVHRTDWRKSSFVLG